MKSSLRKRYLFLFLCYVAVIGVIIYRYFDLPQVFEQKEFSYAEKIVEKIDHALDQQFSQRKVLLEELVEEYSVDIVVYNTETNEEVIATVPYKNSELIGRTNQDAVLLEAQRDAIFEDEKMYVWYSIYHLTDYSLMADFYVEQAVAVMISLFILIIFIFILQKTLYDPLVSIKESLEKMDNYELDNIDVEGSYDVINEKLHEFSKNLAKDIDFAANKQTELARSYTLLTDRYMKSQTLLRSLIHDLKTPIQAMIIENELSSDESQETILKVNQENYYQLMKEVNEILEMVKSDSINADNKETFNVISLLIQTLPRFATAYETKGIRIALDTPETIKITNDIVSVKMLMNNLLSNAVNYSVEDSVINVIVKEDDKTATLIVENESTKESIERMLDSEIYFKAMKDDNEAYEFSSGSGLHLIKNLASIIDADYKVETNQTAVTVSVMFKKDTYNETL